MISLRAPSLLAALLAGTLPAGSRVVCTVTGNGRFQLREVGKERTEFVWEETLTFPLWMGGAVGARFGGPVMARLWRRNLSRLKHHVELDDQPVGRLANA